MAEINYGESDAQRAAKAAEAFTQSSAQGITELEQKYKESVNTLAQGIVTGITPTEKSVLEKSVADLGNRYSQAIAATQGQFAFAQEQATKTSAAMAEQYAQMQDAQRALASQTLGAAGVQLQPGRQTAAQRDALAQAQQIGASNLAFIGGAGAVPETVKSGGIVLPVDTGVIEFAEVVAEVITNENLRSQLRRAGVNRLNEGFAENSAQKFVDLVVGINV